MRGIYAMPTLEATDYEMYFPNNEKLQWKYAKLSRKCEK